MIWLLAASAITFAAAGHETAPTTPSAADAPEPQAILIVPDVRSQAYVFAKGILEDGGFAWRVEGSVQGYAANPVASQRPAPGTKVMDTGEPTIVVRLTKNASYSQRGLPENRSPRRGTAIVLVSAALTAPPAGKPKAETPPPSPPTKKKQQPKAKHAPKTTANKARKPAFLVSGAPPEPLDEMPLPARAQMLGKRLATHRKPSAALVNYWLYQHSWIVTGAKFGWSGGAEALRILVGIDRGLQSRWGFGRKSEAVARAALDEVERRGKN